MGNIRKVQCGACGAKWRCMEGSGLLYGRKETIIEAFSEREKAEVAAQIERSEIPAYDFGYQITVCEYCRSVVSVPVLITGEDETHVGTCPSCGAKVSFPAPDLEKEPCPVCKSRALQTEMEGHWD